MNWFWKLVHICRWKGCWKTTYYNFGRKRSIWCSMHTVERLFEFFLEAEALEKSAGK